MLNKEICRRCVESHSKLEGEAWDKARWVKYENPFEVLNMEQLWNQNKLVKCPLSYWDSFDINGDPPPNCIYTLEHEVLNQTQ